MSLADQSISVIICTRDRSVDLVRCLKSIESQSVQPSDVVIVSGSSDSCPTDIENQFPSLQINIVECFEHNISKSRNVGMANTPCGIVLFIDDDAIAHSGWIAAYQALFEESADAWIAGGPVFDSRENPCVHEFYQGTITSFGSQLPVCPSIDQRKESPYRPTVKGCNFAIRRDKVQGIGGFDPFFRFAFDEADLVFSVYKARGHVVHCQGAVVDHAHTPGHYRQTGPMDHDWRVEYASHAMFILKHNSPSVQRRGKWILRRRYLKLVSTAVICVLRKKITISRALASLSDARKGTREAYQEYQTRTR